ncbi:MAG: hypothetical protein Q8P30_03045 [Candidatus Uhrbacteria bacterium]|nr:hypothetical protein [Candidatus Uhrbacteria bacterium]
MRELTTRYLLKKVTILFVTIFVFGLAFGVTLPKLMEAFAASPPNIISYQGRILNANSVPVSDATASMTFELYDSLTGGECLWPGLYGFDSCPGIAGAVTVSLTDGLFSENLGDTAAGYVSMADDIFGQETALYLEVTVNGETLSPRKQITSAPYALNSDMLQGLVPGNFTLDRAYESGSAVTVDASDLRLYFSAGYNFLVDLQGAGDFVVQDSGVSFWNFVDDSSVYYLPTLANDGFNITANSLTTGSALEISSTSLTTGSILDITATSTPTDGSIVRGLRYDLTNARSTSAGTYIGSDLLYTQNPSVSGGNEDVLHISNQATTNVTDNIVRSLIHLDNADTSATGSTVISNALLITSSGGITSGIVDAIDVSDADIDNAINIGSNTILGTTGVIDFSYFDLSSTGTITQSLSATLGTADMNGSWFSQGAQTFTDSVTAASGTNAIATFNSFAAPTLAATNSSVTTTRAATIYIAGAPIAGTNQTISNANALWVDSGDVLIDDALTVGSFSCNDCLDFITFEDTLDLDASLTMNQAGYTWSQAFTGTTTKGLLYTANSVTSGDAVHIDVTDSLTDGTGSAFRIDYAGSTAGEDLFVIESDVNAPDDLVFRIEADGEVFSDQGFTAGSFSTNYYDGTISSTSNFTIDPSGYVRIGDTATPGTANGDDDLFVEGDFEVDATANFDGVSTFNTDVDVTLTGTENVAILNTTGDAVLTDGLLNVSIVNTDTTAATQYGLMVTNSVDATASTTEALIVLNQSDGDNVTDGLLIKGSFSATYTDAIDASYASIVNALNAGNNNILFETTLMGELTTGTITWGDTSGNTFMTLVDAGTTGDLTVTGTISGADISCSSGDCLDFTELSDSMSLDASTSIAFGANDFVLNLNSTGDFIVQDNGTPFFTLEDDTNIIFTSIETSGTAFDINLDTLTGGIGLDIDAALMDTGFGITADFDGLTTGTGFQVASNSATFANTITGLAHFDVTNASATGNAVSISNAGTGDGIHLLQTGDGQALYIQANDTTDYIASFLNQGHADTNLGIEIQACSNSAPPTAACNFIAFKSGTGAIIGAVEGDGAGGVTNASAGSDYAELFDGVYSDFALGDVIGLKSDGTVGLANTPNEIIGAFSASPNTLGNWKPDWRSTGIYVPVALLGQVAVNVSIENGSITAGDYLTISSTSGVAAKATGVGYVIGQALESTAVDGQIKVFVEPKWHALNVLTEEGSATLASTDIILGATGFATVIDLGEASNELSFRGSGWNGSATQDVEMVMLTEVTDSSDYRLSVRDTGGLEVAHISNEGDLALAGRFYPSDRGTMQTDKYIFYDGSSGFGGDFMRTNASGWSTGSYDFAEMFPSKQSLSPGEVVVFSASKEHVERSTGRTYDPQIVGVISTKPGFLAGENIDGHVPVALAGRVPTYVTNENGSILPGDPLTTSSKGGYAMKATKPGPIIGYAMEPFNGKTGSIITFIRASYYDGQTLGDAPAAVNNVSGFSKPVSNFDMSGTLNLSGGSIVSVGSLSGISSHWRLEEGGDLYSEGRFINVIQSHQGEDIETYGVLSRETTVQLSGTTKLVNGIAKVDFEAVDPSFNDVISTTQPYRVFLTASDATGPLYSLNRGPAGFDIRESNGASTTSVDWLVIAYHKDYEPEFDSTILQDNIAITEEPVVEEVVDESGGATTDESNVVEIIDEVVDPSPTVVEPVAPLIIEPTEAPVEAQVIEPTPEELAPEPIVVEAPATPSPDVVDPVEPSVPVANDEPAVPVS